MEFTLYKSQCHERHPYGDGASVFAVSTLIGDIRFRFECVHFDENGVFVEYRQGVVVDTSTNTRLGSCSMHKDNLYFRGDVSTSSFVVSKIFEIIELLKQTNVNDIEDESSLYESFEEPENTNPDEVPNDDTLTLIEE